MSATGILLQCSACNYSWRQQIIDGGVSVADCRRCAARKDPERYLEQLVDARPNRTRAELEALQVLTPDEFSKAFDVLAAAGRIMAVEEPTERTCTKTGKPAPVWTLPDLHKEPAPYDENPVLLEDWVRQAQEIADKLPGSGPYSIADVAASYPLPLGMDPKKAERLVFVRERWKQHWSQAVVRVGRKNRKVSTFLRRSGL